MKRLIILLLLFIITINANELQEMTVYEIKQKYPKGKFVTFDEYLLLRSKQDKIKADNEVKKRAIIDRLHEIEANKTIITVAAKPQIKINAVDTKPLIAQKAIKRTESNTTTTAAADINVATPFQYGKKSAPFVAKNNKKAKTTISSLKNIEVKSYLQKQPIISNDTNELITQALQTKDYSDWMAQNIIHSIEVNPKYSRAIDIQMVREDFNAGMNEQKLKELQAALLSL